MRRTQEELFVRYDQLNALFLKVEERLTKHHIPRPVEYIYSKNYIDDNPNGELAFECLGLQKVKGKWRICHGTYTCCQDGPSAWTPVVDCSAEVRAAAARHVAKHLPDLEKAVIERTEKFIPEVDSAVQALAKALNQPLNINGLIAERAKLNCRVE